VVVSTAVVVTSAATSVVVISDAGNLRQKRQYQKRRTNLEQQNI